MQRTAMRFTFVLVLSLLCADVIKAQANQDFDTCSTETSPDLALQSCTRAIASRRLSMQDLAYAFNVRGIIYGNRGDADRAIQDYNQAIRLKPDFAEAFFNRGLIYSDRGDNDRAIQDYDQAIRLKPSNPDAFYSRGLIYSNRGDYDRAIQDYNQAIRLKPNNPDAFVSRGNAYDNKGEPDHAIQDYNQAIRRKPNDPGAFVNRGLTYSNRGDYDRAIQDYNQAIQLKPDDEGAFHNRGVAYSDKGEYDRAIQDYDRAIQLKPTDALAFDNRGLTYFLKGEHGRAIQDYDQAIRLDSQYGFAFLTRGIAHFEQGQFAAAVNDFTNGVKLAPNDAYQVIWLYLGQSRAGQKGQQGLSGATQIDLNSWPGPVLSLYQGKITAKALVAAATDPDTKKQSQQLCEAHFYLGQYDLLHELRSDAVKEFQAAATTCPVGYIEYGATQAELKRLGQSPAALRASSSSQINGAGDKAIAAAGVPTADRSNANLFGAAQAPAVVAHHKPNRAAAASQPSSPANDGGSGETLGAKSPPARALPAGALDGIYVGLRFQTATYHIAPTVDYNFLIFSPNGMVSQNFPQEGPDGGGVRPAPAWSRVGRYSVNGNRVEIEWQIQSPVPDHWSVTRDDSGADPQADHYIPICRCNGARLSGTYIYGRNSVQFLLDGTFLDNGALDFMQTLMGNRGIGRGNYRIQNYTLYLAYADGRQLRKSFAAPAVEERRPSFRWIVIADHMFYEQNYQRELYQRTPSGLNFPNRQ
jgi:lipoprotein NlpI